MMWTRCLKLERACKCTIYSVGCSVTACTLGVRSRSFYIVTRFNSSHTSYIAPTWFSLPLSLSRREARVLCCFFSTRRATSLEVLQPFSANRSTYFVHDRARLGVTLTQPPPKPAQDLLLPSFYKLEGPSMLPI